VPKLLLADDSPTTQKVVQLTFADEGVDVIVADDGDAAMELYDHHHPDIVLADINIPGLNGYEVCEAIRKRPSNGSTPVILLAGSFEPFDVEKAHDVGANDYLTKPFSSIRRLVATVTAMLDQATRVDEAVEETIEPNSIPPQVHSETPSSPKNGPGPVMNANEPDMLSTNDIENLYSQSIVESIEMPHTIAERLASESGPADSEPHGQTAKFTEPAFDDELIETTFTFPETEEKAPEQSFDVSYPVPETDLNNPSVAEAAGTLDSSSEIPFPVEELPAIQEEVPQSEIPTVGFEPVIESTENSGVSYETEKSDEVSAAPPTEDLQIDQSSDETYFEPAPAEPAESANGYAMVNHEVSAGLQEQLAESAAVPEITYSQPQENNPPQDAITSGAVEAEQNAYGDVAGDVTPSPWESVAGPAPATFSLDELNLLELPLDLAARNEPPAEHASDVSRKINQLTPEIVDEIARATASQISEELVREIANRIVPKVIEEVMTRKGNENIDQ